MSADIRTYFRSVVVTYGLKEVKEAFDSIENSNKIDGSYFLTYSVQSTENSDNSYVDNHNVEMRIFKKGYRNTQDAFDSLMATGQDIRNLVLNRTTLAAFNSPVHKIMAISPLEMSVEPLDTNDNTCFLIVKFNVKKAFTYCQ